MSIELFTEPSDRFTNRHERVGQLTSHRCWGGVPGVVGRVGREAGPVSSTKAESILDLVLYLILILVL